MCNGSRARATPHAIVSHAILRRPSGLTDGTDHAARSGYDQFHVGGVNLFVTSAPATVDQSRPARGRSRRMKHGRFDVPIWCPMSTKRTVNSYIKRTPPTTDHSDDKTDLRPVARRHNCSAMTYRVGDVIVPRRTPPPLWFGVAQLADHGISAFSRLISSTCDHRGATLSPQ